MKQGDERVIQLVKDGRVVTYKVVKDLDVGSIEVYKGNTNSDLVIPIVVDNEYIVVVDNSIRYDEIIATIEIIEEHCRRLNGEISEGDRRFIIGDAINRFGEQRVSETLSVFKERYKEFIRVIEGDRKNYIIDIEEVSRFVKEYWRVKCEEAGKWKGCRH